MDSWVLALNFGKSRILAAISLRGVFGAASGRAKGLLQIWERRSGKLLELEGDQEHCNSRIQDSLRKSSRDVVEEIPLEQELELQQCRTLASLSSETSSSNSSLYSATAPPPPSVGAWPPGHATRASKSSSHSVLSSHLAQRCAPSLASVLLLLLPVSVKWGVDLQ
ncbi:hypothetical protein LR48_Vigan215s000800 [Vigna angularis]|uniref:Uncharacterized protein n=1 Tax=Phaseolus angularis TaxID=3914 RepID=A0A0L9T626_PHAAN|nr:hypothetical protein LR48_Vigan215s000800 [Vigna angularis]